MSAIQVPAGHSVLFGYGSLLSIRSMERTLGRTYDGPFVPCRIEGWRRTWDAFIPNNTYHAESGEEIFYPSGILYLNVRPDPGAILNGVAFLVNETDLMNFDRRESVYDRVDITDRLAGVFTGGSAYIYVCKPEHRRREVESPRQAAIRATYIGIVETGLSELGPAFRREYEASSDPVPRHLVIQDRSL